MKDFKFRHPSQMTEHEERVPLSTRVKASTRGTLEKSAKKYGLSLAQLSANVLDDYATWLDQHEGSKSKKGAD